MSAYSSRTAHLPLMIGLIRVLRGKRRSTDGGLTIMECLVAILLIGLTTAMITPPLVVATATRVQNRRAEQALQIAQGEIDRINTLVQQGNHTKSVLPDDQGSQANLKSVTKPTKLSNYLKTSRSSCPGKTIYNYQAVIPATEALPVDVDGDCKEDFLVQIFRANDAMTFGEDNKADANQRRPARFDIGIRVYSQIAKKNLSTGNLDTEPASIRMTQGVGRLSTNPLTAVYKPIIWSEQSDSLCKSLSATEMAKLPACEKK